MLAAPAVMRMVPAVLCRPQWRCLPSPVRCLPRPPPRLSVPPTPLRTVSSSYSMTSPPRAKSTCKGRATVYLGADAQQPSCPGTASDGSPYTAPSPAPAPLPPEHRAAHGGCYWEAHPSECLSIQPGSAGFVIVAGLAVPDSVPRKNRTERAWQHSSSPFCAEACPLKDALCCGTGPARAEVCNIETFRPPTFPPGDPAPWYPPTPLYKLRA